MIASAGLRNWPPALLTSTSIRPWRSSTPSKKPSTASSSRMSSASNSALPPRLATSSIMLCSGSLRRPQPITVAPEPSQLERGRPPRPVPAPETTQTCPSSSPGAKMRELALGHGALSLVRGARQRDPSDKVTAHRGGSPDYAGCGEGERGADPAARSRSPGGTEGARDRRAAAHRRRAVAGRLLRPERPRADLRACAPSVSARSRRAGSRARSPPS